MSGAERGGAADGIVSVVVPVYNGATTIVACVESLLALDFPVDRRELIVVDNASTDATLQRLRPFARLVRVLRQPKRGVAAARNAGIRAARGQWVAFTDADCVVDPGWLRHLLLPLGDPAIGISGGRILAQPPCNRIQQFGEIIHDQRRAIEELNPPYAASANWASPRAVLEEAGLFDEELQRGSDVDLAYRLGARGYRLVYCPEAVVFHRHEATLRGLFNEGRDHGRAATRILTMGRHRPLQGPYQHLPTLRRVARSAAGVTNGPARFDAFCAMIFNLGKATGALLERISLTRSRPQS